MNRFSRNLSLFLVSLFCVLLPMTACASDPVGDFFKRLGNSIANAGKKPAPKRSAGKSGSKRDNTEQAGISPTPSPSPSAAPNQVQTVRAAKVAPVNTGRRRDVPYGIPVPSKPGFVTSPYAPAAGLVDVRDFPPGTEVTDPYSGRVFLTP